MTTIYVDGACKGNHLPGKLRTAGAGAYIDFLSDSTPVPLPADKTQTANTDPLKNSGTPESRFAWRKLPSMAQQEAATGQPGKAVTNNRAELVGVIMALDIVGLHGAQFAQPLTIVTDSELLYNAVTKWMPGWRRRNYRKKDGKPVANAMLVRQLDELLQKTKHHNIEWLHMRSHRQEPDDRNSAEWRAWHGNDVADQLANWASGKTSADGVLGKKKKIRKRKPKRAAPSRNKDAPRGPRKQKKLSIRRRLQQMKL